MHLCYCRLVGDVPAEPSRWQDNVRFSPIAAIVTESVCVCVYLPILCGVSMWVECGERRRQKGKRRLTHKSDAPKRDSVGFEGCGSGS